MKYLVTGNSGFIGSHICEHLLKQGHIVIGIDDMSTGTLENLNILKKYENFHFIHLDVCQIKKIKELNLNSLFEDISCVFHVCALARIQPSIQTPMDCLNRNINGLMNILEFMKEFKIRNIVFSSSSSVYGLKNSNKLPFKEDYEPDCLNQYSWSKYAGEKLIETYCKLYGFDAINLRYFNVYGPREVLEGEYAPLIGIFYRKILKEKLPMTIVGDGEQTRDMTHVYDVVKANIRAMEYLSIISNAGYCETFNVGTGKDYSVNAIASLILTILGTKDVKVEKPIHIDERPGEARQTRADISKAKNILHWEPTIDLNVGLMSQAEYYLKKYLQNK